MAQSENFTSGIDSRSSALVLEFPVLDYPYNWSNGYTAPSMQQSLHFTKGVYQSVHFGIEKGIPNRPVLRNISIIGFDVLMSWLPFGNAWLHEEWHRAVMGKYGIDSYNEVYDIPLFADSIAVSHVKDSDLIRLKHENPADMARLHAAGIEAQNELNFAIENDLFFHATKTWDDVLLWLNTINNISYLYTCASNQSNILTEEILNTEGPNIDDRDFTGLDCNAWVYDLFRPNEPYANRGVHPSGNGVNRYIKYDDLDNEEQDYLKKQFYLSFLNLADPFMYRFHRFYVASQGDGSQLEFNFNMRHLLTASGYTIDANLFVKQSDANWLFSLHNYFNHKNYFPGLEVSLIRFPVRLVSVKSALTTRAALWLQPKNQAFTTSQAQLGGLLSLRLAYPLTNTLDTFLELESKSDGWVAGNVYLESNFSFRIGLKAFIN